MEPFLHILLKLYVIQKRVEMTFTRFCDFKAFVLERTNSPPNINRKNGVHRGKERIEENGCCTPRVGVKLCRDY